MLTLHDSHAEKSTSSNQMAFCRETGVWPMFEIMWGSLVNSSAPGREPSLDWSSTPTVCSSCGRTWVMQWYGLNFGTSVGWSQWLQAFYTPCCLLLWYRFMWFDCRICLDFSQVVGSRQYTFSIHCGSFWIPYSWHFSLQQCLEATLKRPAWTGDPYPPTFVASPQDVQYACNLVSSLCIEWEDRGDSGCGAGK